jgi:GAF domain-containing protein
LYEIVQPDNLWHQPALTISEMLGIVVQATRAKSGSMLLLDQNQGIAESAVSYNGDTQPVNPGQFSDTLENGLAGWVARNQQAVLIDDTWKDSRWLRRTWEETEGCSRSAMSAPVHRNGQVAGVLTLLQDSANAFKPDDLALLVTLSAIITLAVRQKTT